MPEAYSPLESAAIRGDFPALEDYTFLNAAGMTPLPAPARDAMNAMLHEMCESAYVHMDRWAGAMRHARTAAADLLGAGEDEIAFVRNTSEGVSRVASGLRFEPGDEVIINDIEFPSNVYPWLNLGRKGVVVKTVRNVEGRVTPDMIAAEVTPRTRVVAISSAQWLTGYRADLAALGQMAHERGFHLFVDAIQTAGAFPLDVRRLNISFAAFGCFKWMCGPVGTGIFYCARERLEDLDLTSVGWNTVKNSSDYATIDFTLRDTAERFEEGSPNGPGIAGLLESIRLVTSRGVERNGAQILELTDYLAEALLSRGCRILSPRAHEAEKSGILVFMPPPGRDVDQLLRRLADEKILVIKRMGGVRVSPHFFNTTEDIDRLIDAVGR